MNAIQGYIAWLPALLQDKDNGAGLTSVAWNASGLLVKYQKAGGAIQTKTLTSGDWVEGVDGSYNIRFSAVELNTLGLFSYWLEHPQSSTYPGAITVIAAPASDVAAESTLLSVGTTVGEIKTAIDSLPTDVATPDAVAAVSSTLSGLETAINALPTDVATSGAVVSLNGAIDAVKAAVDALPVDVATSGATTALGTAIDTLKTAVDALPIDVASSQSVADLAAKVDAISVDVTLPAAAVGVGFSMNATQRKAMWLPVQLTNGTTGAALTGLTFDAVTVKYQKPGEAVVTKTLTAEQWSEGVDGSYSIYFTSDELDTLGTLRYWAEYTSAATYPGVALVTEAGAGSGSIEKTIRIIVKGQPIKDCEVWVTTDAAGRDKIAGPRYTDILGVATVFVDPGDYWVHYRKAREVEYGKKQWSVTNG